MYCAIEGRCRYGVLVDCFKNGVDRELVGSRWRTDGEGGELTVL
jgi:hypothetical protein